MARGQTEFCELADSRQPVHSGDYRCIVNFCGGDFSRPTNDARDADAPFIKTAFAASKRSGAAHTAMSGVVDMNVFRAIIARKKNKRVGCQSQIVERLEQPA